MEEREREDIIVISSDEDENNTQSVSVSLDSKEAPETVESKGEVNKVDETPAQEQKEIKEEIIENKEDKTVESKEEINKVDETPVQEQKEIKEEIIENKEDKTVESKEEIIENKEDKTVESKEEINKNEEIPVQKQKEVSTLPPVHEEQVVPKKTDAPDLPPVRKEFEDLGKPEVKKGIDIPQSYDIFQKNVDDGESFEQQAKSIIYYKPGSDKIPEKIRQREKQEISQDNPWAKELKEQKEKKLLKEKEKAEEDKNKKPTIKYNKFSKVMMYILIVAIVMNLLLCLLQFANADFSNFIWIKVNNHLTDFLYSIVQNISGFIPYSNIVLLIISSIVVVISIVLFIIFRKNIEKQSIILNIFIPIIAVVVLIINTNCYVALSNMSHRGINEIYLKDFINSEYSDEKLENLVDYFKSRIVLYAESLNRKGDKIDVINPYDLAVGDLKNLSVKYEFLNGEYPTKIRNLTEYDLKHSGYPVALTFNFSVGIDNNLTDLEKIFTLTHEFCHVKGVFRESDTNYCAFLASYNSNNDISKYSMYINLMPNLLRILKKDELRNSIINEFGSICLDSGYYEICNMYSKDINRFIEGSDTIEFYTYSLDTYSKKKEELKQYLVGLKNRFNITIKDEDGKEISIDNANSLIDKSESIGLHLIGSIDEKKYNENMQYLNTISDYFSNLFLNNSKEKTNDSHENFNYLKPNPTGMFASITEKYPEFDYDRAVRSILEYFDKYVFN